MGNCRKSPPQRRRRGRTEDRTKSHQAQRMRRRCRCPTGIGKGRIPAATALPATSTVTTPTRGRNTTSQYRPASVADSGCVRWSILACRSKRIGSTIAFQALRGRRREGRRKDWRTGCTEPGWLFAEGRSTVVEQGRHHQRWYCRSCG